MIYYSLPWNSQQNVGAYYNAFMKMLPSEEDYACFLDGDATFTTTKYGLQLEDIVERYPKCGLFVGRTNRVKCAWQVVPNVDFRNNDIEYHRTVGQGLAEKHWDLCAPVDPNPTHLMSGVLFVLKKALWKKLGGFLDTGMLGVDNDLHRRCLELGEEILLMQGLYVYHWYRNNLDDVSHLVRPAWELAQRAVYTCITGDYDELKEPAIVTPGWDYICFTDNKSLKSPLWKIRPLDRAEDSCRLARRVKCLAHEYLKEYALTVWVDGKLRIKCDLDSLMRRYYDGVAPMALFRHPDRACIYEEAEACKALGKDDPAVIDQQMERLRSAGFPPGLGLVETSMLIRDNMSPEVRRACEEWWREIRHGSRRDQLSFNYVAWRLGFKFKEIDFAIVGTLLEKTGHAKPPPLAAPIPPPIAPLSPSESAIRQDRLPELDIIVPQFNGSEDTIRCIRSIRAYAPPNTRVILVDDGSREAEFKAAARELSGFPHITIRNSKNLGFVHAANVGIGASRAPYIVIQNNDTEIYPGSYERMKRVLLDQPDAGVVGPVGSLGERTWQSIGKLTKLFGDVNDAVNGFTLGDDAAVAAKLAEANLPPKAVDGMVAFFCVMIPRKVVEKVGLLASDYGPGLFDDDDYCARARKEGLKIYLAADAYVRHVGASTFRRIYPKEDYYELMERNRELFEKRCREKGLVSPPRPDQVLLGDSWGPAPHIFTGLRAVVCMALMGDRSAAQMRLLDSLLKNVPASVPINIWAQGVSKTVLAALGSTTRWQYRTVKAEVPKHQAMRVLFEPYKENPTKAEWIVWLEDSAHVTGFDWWSRTEEFISSQDKVCCVGAVRDWTYRNGAWQQMTRCRWYRGKQAHYLPSGSRGVKAVDEAYFWLRTDLIRQLDWPDERIGRGGGIDGVPAGALLGEALRQADLKPHEYTYGVEIAR